MTGPPPGARAFMARLVAVPEGDGIRPLDLNLPATPEQDKARKYCRRHKLAFYDRPSGKWIASLRGRAWHANQKGNQ